MANQWFKFYGGEYLSDPKIERLSPLERSCWLTILCMASMGVDGVIEFLTVESLLNRSGIQFDPYHPEEWEKALSVLVKFQNLKMIETNDEGQIKVKNWEKRQEHNLTVAERVAKHRQNKAYVTTNVTNVTTEENRVEENRVELNSYVIEDEKPKKEKTTLEGFESWFLEYPRKQNKQTASAVWRKLSSEDRTKALEDTRERKKTTQWNDPQFIPLPNNYLEGRRWEDEIVKKAPIKSYGVKK